MKFWQLVSLLRDRRPILAATFEDPRWRGYGAWLRDFDAIVNEQDRAKLDASMPDDLVRAALREAGIAVYRSGRTLRSRRAAETDRVVPAEEVFDSYGGDVVEEIFERGSVQV
ncbi:hypothetical protein [Jannaschia sp. LMIT008]|uniref:hypothetical protein n=1 Tax=Jannaschia maritima TaxID=3032585 RepID=UPI002812243C|nr:hypothetical protein [Jannaschia sp. LMIT008]